MNRSYYLSDKIVSQKKYLIIISALVLIFSACKKEVNSPAFNVQLITNSDSIYAGNLATFDFSGSSADNITIYTGDPGHNYANYPADKGAPVTTPYGKYYYTYPQGGNFTVTVIATNSGAEGTKFKEDVKTFQIVVKDRRPLSITKFVVSSKKGKVIVNSPAGTFNQSKDTITVFVEPGTNIAKLNPVITKTADSAKINYGSGNTLLRPTDSIDFTAPLTFTISSPNNASQKSYLVIVKERKKKKDTYLLNLTSLNKIFTVSKSDTANKKVTIKIPWGIKNLTDTSTLIAVSSPNTIATLGGAVINDAKYEKFNLELNKKDTISVLSEDGSKTGKYAFRVTQDSVFTSFTLNDSINSLNASSQLVTIDNAAHTIIVKLLGDSKLLKKGYNATFKGADYAIVKVKDTVQVSGITKNNFSNPVTYSVVSKETGRTTAYTVSIVFVQ